MPPRKRASLGRRYKKGGNNTDRAPPKSKSDPSSPICPLSAVKNLSLSNQPIVMKEGEMFTKSKNNDIDIKLSIKPSVPDVIHTNLDAISICPERKRQIDSE